MTDPVEPEVAERSLGQGWVIALLVLLAALGIGAGWERATGAFGNSDEGLNSSVWAMCSRSLRADPIGSALGGRRLDGVDYATHPPLTCATAAGAEAMFGEREWVSRAPAWLASLSLVPLIHLLLVRLGNGPAVAAAGCFVALGSGMVNAYGSMLDTPVASLPVAVLVALALTREQPCSGGAPWSSPSVVAVSVLAGLFSWQVGLFALLAGAATWRWGATPRRSLLYLGGAGTGLALSVGWGWWVYGSLAALRSKLGSRSTGDSSLPESLGFQVDWLIILFGLGLLGLVAALMALTDARHRIVLLPALGAAAAWSIGFHGGAAGHQYWNYFMVLPIAIGSAWGLSRLARAMDRHPSITLPGTGVVLGLAVLVGCLGLLVPNQATTAIESGRPTGEMLRSAHVAGVDGELPVVGDDRRIWAIVVYYLGLDTAAIDREGLEEMVEGDPASPVLIALPCPTGPPTLCDDLPDDLRVGDQLTTAAEVATALASGPDLGD